MKRPPVLIWYFEDAPEEFKATSPHGGDEDWVLAVPVDCYDNGEYNRIEWSIVDRIDVCGYEDSTSQKVTYDGKEWYVYITAHA